MTKVYGKSKKGQEGRLGKFWVTEPGFTEKVGSWQRNEASGKLNKNQTDEGSEYPGGMYHVHRTPGKPIWPESEPIEAGNGAGEDHGSGS